ncbi:MAG: hypothetical protein ABFE07_28905 [Armatimonadia bacterium]
MITRPIARIVADKALGTKLTIEQLVEHFHLRILMEDPNWFPDKLHYQLEQALLDLNIERCNQCLEWNESFALVGDDEDEVGPGYCFTCRERLNPKRRKCGR